MFCQHVAGLRVVFVIFVALGSYLTLLSDKKPDKIEATIDRVHCTGM